MENGGERMEGFLVRGGERLKGSLRVGAAKNAVLPILAASILADSPSTLVGCPRIADVESMRSILQTLGCESRWEPDGLVVSGGLSSGEMPEKLSKRVRSSIFLLGPILARLRHATVVYPGGCEIGLRPIDLHLSGLKRMGVEISETGGVLRCDGSRMHAADVHLDYPSVGATENVIMAAALTQGVTTVTNAAREPEIEDLQAYINAMGGHVQGAGSPTVTIEGARELHGAVYAPMPDRIAAGTYLCAAAITGGEITLDHVQPRHLTAVLQKLREMGCEIEEGENVLSLRAPQRLQAFDTLQTQPHPGFPTDMQSPMMALAAVARGSSVIVENVFENRFALAADLNRMGARIRVAGRAALIEGVESLHGVSCQARDLRGGAALVLTGLCAKEETLITGVELIDRGYERMETELTRLGAQIRRISVTE